MSAPLASAASAAALDLTGHWAGIAALAVFALAYLVVMGEERLHVRKSKPVMVAAGVIWSLVALAYVKAGQGPVAAAAVRHSIGEFAELFLFILVAMTFVNTMEERQLFDALRAWLVRRRLSLRQVFWATGVLAFFLSSMLDNLTTALVMGAVAITVGRGNARFVALACINVVVAANAGGAFSPFGDITTLMVWQAGRAQFWEFFALFVPSLVNWLVPAALMSLAVPAGVPDADEETVQLRRGAWGVVGIFALTIAMAVSAYNVLQLPPVLGMTTGMAFLKLYGHYLQRTGTDRAVPTLAPPPPAPAAAPAGAAAQAAPALAGAGSGGRAAFAAATPLLDAPELAALRAPDFAAPAPDLAVPAPVAPPRAREDAAPPPPHEAMAEPLGGIARPARDSFDIYDILRGAEWDTLLFFYGIILSVGGLAQIGYLAGLSESLYGGYGPTLANVAVGLMSAVVDNIPVMFAVLSMHPAMDHSQWLLVTLTAGVGGSLLSIGSAAGVALMGQARGQYTFFTHLRWTWAIALGYAASIWVHLLLNG